MRILVPIQKNNKKTEIKLGTTGSDAWSGYCVYKNRPFSDPEFHGNGNVPSIVRYRGGGPGHKISLKVRTVIWHRIVSPFFLALTRVRCETEYCKLT